MSRQLYRIEWCGGIKVYVPERHVTEPDEDQMAWAEYHQMRHEADA